RALRRLQAHGVRPGAAGQPAARPEHRAGPERRKRTRRRGHAVTLTPGAVIRTGLLLLLTMVLQVSTFSQLDVLGGNADITGAAVAAIGLYSGSVPGAIAGFSAGLLLDLALGANLGATSLVLTPVGYFC